MDISVFFTEPAIASKAGDERSKGRLLASTAFFQGDMDELKGRRMALIGVCEERQGSANQGTANAPDAFRKWFYELYAFDSDPGLVDLGNIHPGAEVKDTYYALTATCEVLIRQGIIPLIIGGSQDLTYANYLAYEKLEQTVNLVTIDRCLDFGQSTSEHSSGNYLNRIVLHKPNYLFNYSNIGHQRYLTDPELIDLMGKMYFDVYRLGEIQPFMALSEPVIRNADIVSFDMSAIRQSECPGHAQAGPNGFYGDQAAQMCRYAGMSDKLTSFGVYELNPDLDPAGQSAHLAAQMVWCFIEGYLSRKSDYPMCDFSEYTKYIVHMEREQHELVFYKSHKSDRWWMDVPYPAGEAKYERHHLVPCTYEEYLQTSNEELPDRWWKTYQKLV
ncbi:MAG: hypothetical protein RL220_202 [Bacteroidota bacterium]|jgi:arginase family enzyme